MCDPRPEDAELDDRILEDDVVIRNIPPYHLIDIDESGRRKRVSKSAFSGSSKKIDPEEGMSVDLLSKLIEHGISPQDPTYQPDFEVLMSLGVDDLRQLGLEVVRRPLPENPAHCHVLRVRSPALKKKLLERADWVRRPPHVFKSVADANRAIGEIED